jgi:poly(A) polymerase
VIDYVGGLDDLRARVVRAIGDPDIRLPEDPVRMLRAAALAARLDFTIDPLVVDAIRRHRQEIAKSSPPRMLEEYYKILRAGASERAFRDMADLGLLEPVSTELQQGATDRLWRSLAALDAYRRRFEATPETLTNPILLGSLLVPLGVSLQSDTAPRLGSLPLARRDVERLGHILALQRRLRDLNAHPRAQRALTHRHHFRDALTWFEIHAGASEVVEHWKGVLVGEEIEPTTGLPEAEPTPPRRRRRRRRRRRNQSQKSEV